MLSPEERELTKPKRYEFTKYVTTAAEALEFINNWENTGRDYYFGYYVFEARNKYKIIYYYYDKRVRLKPINEQDN